MTELIAAKKHASKPPSGAFQWGGCPGSLALEMTLPEEIRNPTSEFAMLGTAAHDVLERCLTQGKVPGDFRDRLIEVIEDGSGEGTSMLAKSAKMPKDPRRNIFICDDDMVEAVKVCHDYILSVVEEHGLTGEAIKAERRTKCLPEREDCYGTVDNTLDAWPELLEVVDYKNGSGVVVEVSKNKQLWLYLLGVAIETGFSHERFKVTIAQPRAPHANGSIRSEEVTADELKAFHAEMLRAADDVDRAQAVFDDEGMSDHFVETFLDPGELGKHCLWCSAKGFCPAATKLALEQAAIDFGDLDDEPSVLDTPTDPEMIGKLLPWLDFVESWAKATAIHAQQWLEAGGDSSLMGYKLVNKKSSGRKWVAEMDALEAKALAAKVAKQFGLDKNTQKKMFNPPKPATLITGVQMEKLVPVGDERTEFQDDYLYKPPGALTIAPLSDKREEVMSGTDAASDFEGEEL